MPDKVVPISQMAQFCRTIGTTLSDNWNHLVEQLEQPCRTIETTLSDNWNHLVIKMKTQKSRVKSQKSWAKSQEARVKSQESRLKTEDSRVKSQKWKEKVKIRVREKNQKSKVEKEIQHCEETSSQSSSYLNHPRNKCHVTRNIPQVTYVFAILCECYDVHMLINSVSQCTGVFLLHQQQSIALPFLFLFVLLI